jgi:hypothetical protein
MRREYTLERDDFLTALKRGQWLENRRPTTLFKNGRFSFEDWLGREGWTIADTNAVTNGVFVTRSGRAFEWHATEHHLVLIDEGGAIAHMFYKLGIPLKKQTFRTQAMFAWDKAEELGHLDPPLASEIKWVRNIYFGELPRTNVPNERILEIITTWRVRSDFATWKQHWTTKRMSQVRCGIVVAADWGVYYWVVLSEEILQLFDADGKSCLFVAPSALPQDAK